MDVRVEPSLGLDLRKTFLGQQIVERAVHEPDSVLELRLLVIRGGLERPPEIVEDRDQLLDEPFVGALGKRRLLARIALAEVVELRGEPLEPIEKRIAFSLESLDVDALLGSAGLPPGPLLACSGVTCSSVVTTSEPPALRR